MFKWLRKVGTYFKNDAIAVDDLGNALAAGKPTETISARSQRAADRGNVLGEVIVDGLDAIQKDHGVKAEKGALARNEDVVETEKKALGEK